MSLIEQIEVKLQERAKQNSAAYAQLWEVRNEIAELAKRVGSIQAFRDGFWYFSPDRRGNTRVFQCYVENDKAIIQFDGEDTPMMLEGISLERTLRYIAERVANRLANAGRYKI
jgi:hypothetical protein